MSHKRRNIVRIVRMVAMLVLAVLALLVTPAAQAASTNFVHHAEGRLRIGAINQGRTTIILDNGTSLKRILDGIYAQARPRLNAAVETEMQRRTKMRVRANLAAPGSTELRTRTAPNGDVTLKYVLHRNRLDVFVGAARLVVTFDAELVLTIPRSEFGQSFQVREAYLAAYNGKLDAGNVGGAIVKSAGAIWGWLTSRKSYARLAEAEINAQVIDFGGKVNGVLTPLAEAARARLPHRGGSVSAQVDDRGDIRICFSPTSGQRCAFPQLPPIQVKRATLDTSIDRCSRPVVWVYDIEKKARVPIRKGARNVEIQTGWEIEWYCGWADRPGTQERAAGPTGTSGVRISRGADGDRIDWGFLFWR